MNWKTWTKIAAVILFIIAIVNFYFAYFHNPTAELTIQNFPEALDSLDNEKDITFSFFLYNDGNKPAFVNSMVFTKDGDLEILSGVSISPNSDFSINAQESREVQVTLPALNEDGGYELTATIYYNEEKLSDSTFVNWGSIS